MTNRSFNGAANDIDTGLFVAFGFSFQFVQNRLYLQQSGTAAGHDAFSHSSTSSVQSIFDTQFLVFQFGFGSSTNFDHSYAAGQFGQTFLQFFFVELRRGGRDLSTDGSNPIGHSLFVAAAIHDGGHILGNPYLAGSTQISQGCAVQFPAHFFTDDSSTGQSCDILQHRLPTITEARSLHSHSLEGATQTVHNQGCQGFAFHIFSNDQQFTALLYHFFQNRHNVVDQGDLPVGNEYVRIAHNGFHLVRIRYHVRGNVATVELHAFYGFQRSFHGLGFFYGDHAVITHFFHGIGNQAADFFITGRNGSNLCFFFLGADSLGRLLQFIHQSIGSFLDALLQDHGVGTGHHVLHAFMHNGLGQHRSGGGTIAGDVIGLGGNFTDQGSAHVFKWIFQFNVLGNGHAIIGDGGRTEFLFQDNVTAFGPQCYFYGISQFIDAAFQAATSIFIKFNQFSHFNRLLNSR